MKINITNKQYLSLLKLIYLGEYVTNGNRLIENQIKDFDELAQYVYSLAKDFKCESLVEFDGEDFYPTRKMEEELDEYISEYEELSFWEELVNRLARKNFIKRYGIEKINSMDYKEKIHLEHEFLDKYGEEVEKNGITNIDLLK